MYKSNDRWCRFFPPPKQVLNLFLALLLSNFGSSNLSAPTADNDTNKIAEAIDRIARFIKWIKRNILYIAKLMRAKFTNQISDQAPGEGPSNSWKEGLYPIRSLAVCAVVVLWHCLLVFCFTFTLLPRQFSPMSVGGHRQWEWDRAKEKWLLVCLLSAQNYSDKFLYRFSIVFFAAMYIRCWS